ncbi:MAG: DUF58 domain-containing protein [Ruminococcus sp.]|nr:DUF58 domain-containing protein [Ruminococcus sp.]
MELIAVVLLLAILYFGEIAVYHRNGLERLSYRCGFSQDHVTEGETITLTETIENAKALPIPWIKTELTIPKWLDFPESHCTVTDQTRFVTSFFSIRGYAKIKRAWQVQCSKRGIYRVEHVVLVTSDLLGAVRLSLMPSDLGETITVLPQRFTAAGRLLPRLFQNRFGEDTVRQSLRTDPCLPAGIRAYCQGDSLNRIHWKASVHRGQLFVRQEEPIAQRSTTVLLALETNPIDSGNVTQDAKLLEHTIRVCAQCLWELLQDGWLVRLCVNEANSQNTPRQTPYGSGSGMYAKLMECLAVLSLQTILPVSQLLQIGTGSTQQEALILITPYTDPQIKQWKRQTNGIVLVTGHAHDHGACADTVVAQF